MSETGSNPMHRREFIQHGAAAAAAATALARRLPRPRFAGEQGGAAKDNRVASPGAGQDGRAR